MRFSHGARSGKKAYQSSFIPGLHDMCIVLEKPRLGHGEVAARAGGTREAIAVRGASNAAPDVSDLAAGPLESAERLAVLDTVDLRDGARMELTRSHRNQEMQIRFVFPNAHQRPPQQATQTLKQEHWAWQREERCWTKPFDPDAQHRAQVDAERLFHAVAVGLQSEKTLERERASCRALGGVAAEARLTGTYAWDGAAHDERLVRSLAVQRAGERRAERLQRRLLAKVEHLLAQEGTGARLKSALSLPSCFACWNDQRPGRPSSLRAKVCDVMSP